MDVREQRVQFVVAAARGEKSFSALCREFGVTRPTGYVWLRRYQQAGLAGIAERSRRPQRSPRVTASGIQQRVIGLRQQYPDWGARKLRELLEAEGICLPRSTVHRILLRHNLVAGADRRSKR